MKKLFLNGAIICVSILVNAESGKAEPSDVKTEKNYKVVIDFDFSQIGGRTEFLLTRTNTYL